MTWGSGWRDNRGFVTAYERHDEYGRLPNLTRGLAVINDGTLRGTTSVDITTDGGNITLCEPSDCFPSDELLAKVILVAG